MTVTKRTDAGLRRLPSGSWQALWRDPDGRQRGRSFPTKREAREFRDQQLVDMRRGVWTDPAGAKVKVGEWVELFLETRPVGKATEVRRAYVLNNYLLPRFGQRPIGAITPRDVKLWVKDLEQAGLSRGSVEKAYRLLAQIMAEAVDEDLIGKSPCRGVKFDPTTPPPTKPRALTTAEATQLLERLARKPAARTLVLLLLGSGIRWGEATGLRRQRVHLLKRPPTIEIIETLHEVSGQLEFGPPKTRTSERTVPLPRTVANALAQHLPANGAPTDLVFTTPSGSPLRRTNFSAATWLPAVKQAGLEGLRVHDLRHSYASILENHGVPRVITAELLGHAASGGGMTAGYVHAYQEAINQAVEVVEEWLGVVVGGLGHTRVSG